MSVPATPFTVISDYPYDSTEQDDLQFGEGQVITVETIEDEEWYYGSFTDASGNKHVGIFPQNFVHAYTPPKHVTPGRKAPQPPQAAQNTQSSGDKKGADVQLNNPARSPVLPAASVPQPSIASFSPPSSSGAVPSQPPSATSANSASMPSATSTPSAATSNPEPKPARKKNAFADRIAAFNTATESPISPVSAPKPSSFVRKPFVATPSNSYVPQVPTSNPPVSSNQSHPQQQQQPAPENIVHKDDTEEGEDDGKPIVSLKDRIRLLQQQQEEERARMEALAAKKKNKSKAKQQHQEAGNESGIATEDVTSPSLEPITSAGSVKSQQPQQPRSSIDAVATGGSYESVGESVTSHEGHAQRPPVPQPMQRRSSMDEHSIDGHDQHVEAPAALEIVAEDDNEREVQDEEEEGDDDDEEEEEEEEEDEEEAKLIALRNRMAKISGGMGMVGMMGGFGFPGAMPPAPKPKKTKKKADSEQEQEQEAEARQAPIPILPMANPSSLTGLNLGYPKPPKEQKNEEMDQERDVGGNDTDTDDSSVVEVAAPVPPARSDSFPHDDNVPVAPVRNVPSVPAAHASTPALGTESRSAPIPPTRNLPPPPTPGSAPVPPSRDAAPAAPASTAPSANNDLGAVIDAYRSDSDEDEGSDGNWGEEDTKPVQRVAHAASTAPPIPTISEETKSKTQKLPSINTSPLLSHAEEPHQASLERTKSSRSKRESFDLSSPKKSLDHDQLDENDEEEEEEEGEEDVLTDDDTRIVESEDIRRVTPKSPTLDTSNRRTSYIAGSGSIPPIPISPLVHQSDESHAARPNLPPPPPPPTAAETPQISSPTGSSQITSPTGPPPPPPPGGAAPTVPIQALATQSPAGYTAEESTGYEADLDTDENKNSMSSVGGISGGNVDGSSMLHTVPPVPVPVSRTLPPSSGPGLGRSTSLSHKGSSGSPNFRRGHTHTQSYAQSPRAPPPPPPSAAAPAPGSSSTSATPLVKSSEPESTSRFGFKRASTDLGRTASRRASQGIVPQQSPQSPSVSKPDQSAQSSQELPYTIDLSNETGPWWTSKEGVPSSLLQRAARNKDVLYEVETHEIQKRSNRVVCVHDVYVLFPDYSQEVITVEYDAQRSSEGGAGTTSTATPIGASASAGAHVFKSRLEAPNAPSPEELASAYRRYGKPLLDIISKSNGQLPSSSTTSSSSAQGYVSNIMKQLSNASNNSRPLLPVGNSSFGALVYLNKNNSYVRQYDEIKPGDVVAFNSAKFQGHKGGLHQKYSTEAGRNGLVNAGVVYEYDASKRKMKVYLVDEASGSGGKIKSESFRLNDFKSGDVSVYRVVGRDYVGW